MSVIPDKSMPIVRDNRHYPLLLIKITTTVRQKFCDYPKHLKKVTSLRDLIWLRGHLQILIPVPVIMFNDFGKSDLAVSVSYLSLFLSTTLLAN